MNEVKINIQNYDYEKEENLLIKEFFVQIETRLIEFFKNKNGIEDIIRKILNYSENLNDSLDILTNNIGNFLYKFSNNPTENLSFNFTVTNNIINNNILKKGNNNKQKNMQINNNINIDNETQRKIDKMLNDNIKVKIKEKYSTVPGKVKDNILIQDEKGNRYQYYFGMSSRNFIFLNCGDSTCKGKGKIDKNTLEFYINHHHSKPIKEHSFMKNKNKDKT